MIQIIDCDIFKHEAQCIIHQANCWCRMKSGVAAGINKYYPEAVEADNQTVVGDIEKMGKFTSATGKDGKVIYNLYGQYKPGTDSRKTDYEAFYSGLTLICKDIIIRGITHVSLPYNIGCGLAGGDWRIISNIIEVVFSDHPKIEKVDLCRYNG